MDKGRQRFLELLGKSRLKGSERAKLEGGEGEGGREGRPKEGGGEGEGVAKGEGERMEKVLGKGETQVACSQSNTTSCKLHSPPPLHPPA